MKALFLLVFLASSACRADTAPGTDDRATELGVPSATAAELSPGDSAGFVVWESNRSGAFRIWRQDLAGGDPKQISPEEAGRDHCCAELSPNGQRLVYLSVPGGARGYSPASGVLHLADSDGGRDRVLVPAARHYGEHRIAVWWGLDQLLYLDGDGSTVLRVLSTGKEELLARVGPTGEGWLISPGGLCATGNTPTFSPWSRQGGVREQASLGGCQPAFSTDGRRAVWSAGAGGPIDAIDLTTRESWTILRKNDPRVPADRSYLYFPKLSADATLLAFAGSNNEHDHFRADYDVLLIDVDPRTLAPTGKARAIAPHPAVDRFPDPFRSAVDPETAQPAAATARAEREASAADSRGAGPVLSWNTESPATILRPRATAWLDRQGGMALAGGSFEADPATGAELTQALQSTHQFSIALAFAPSTLDQTGALLALSDGGRRTNFVLRQSGADIELVLRTSDTPREGRAERLATLTSTATVHLAVTFSPGRLAVYVDGGPIGSNRPFPGDFFAWKPATFAAGAEAGQASRFAGAISRFAIWNRPLSAAEVRAETERSRSALSRAGTARISAELRVLQVTAAPDLASISPYREALVVDAAEIVRSASAALPVGTRIRRVRWAILDASSLPSSRVGALERVVVEPFDAQPQLEPYYLGDSTDHPDQALWFDLGGSVAR